jgi:predicted membrane protein
MKKRVVAVDIVAIVGIFCLLLAAIFLKFEKYLFRLPFVTLFAFYLIGKYARDYELKLWEKRHNDPSGPSIDKRDA